MSQHPGAVEFGNNCRLFGNANMSYMIEYQLMSHSFSNIFLFVFLSVSHPSSSPPVEGVLVRAEL